MASQTTPFNPTEAFLQRAATGMDTKGAAAAIGIPSPVLRKMEMGVVEAAPEVLEALRKHSRSSSRTAPAQFKFIDLFAGIGGMRRAFEASGGECVFTAEWNRYALETYVANHGADHPIVGDITQVPAADVPDHDVLVGGFPCQPFSLAGVSKKNSLGRAHGFADETQGTLFFDVARIIEAKRPRMFLLENVKNLCDHDKGRTFDVILRTLKEELGYNVSYRVLNGNAWVPQKRNRIFIVGVREGEAFDFDDVVIPENGPVLGDILHRMGEVDEDPRYSSGGNALAKYTLTDNLWRYLQDYAAKHAKAGNGFGFGLVGEDDVTRTLSARYGKDGSEVLVRQSAGLNPRRLTPRECARLQGFDSLGSQIFIPVSDAQAYRQFGNSVVVPCVAAIASAMVPYLEMATDTNFRQAS
ncbi:DNA (cytosine-5-)-methyltransferase [Agrobacterium rubi]|nr:DNA (cytosine-5-)-methyltransferase [Agrobacterium rubi]NTF24546.1 DNA (cytosine-5-)-methyltransferase [Agrobacterium rubi]